MTQDQKKKIHAQFVSHLIRNLIIGIFAILTMLFVGMLGYHFFNDLEWIDAFVDASMILSGMGPVKPLVTPAGKIFAGCYALASGLAFIVIVGIVFSPVIHRILRKIHLEDKNSNS